MKYLRSVFGIELIAILLSFLQSTAGVLTDEAKYLLNIPYPHPPLVRFLMGITDWMPIQEMFWRIILATLLFQSVWFVIDLGRDLPKSQKKILGFFWIFSAAAILQAGTIMMAPITAVQVLVFIWLLNRSVFVERYPAFIALFWLVSLFTAYQIVLFIPIVFLVFWKARLSCLTSIIAVSIPILLLVIYTLTNPLILASMFSIGTQNVYLPVSERFLHLFSVWLVGGSAVLSVFGTYGIVVKKQWAVLASFVLLLAYIFLSYHLYYAILFLPIFISGVTAFPKVLLLRYQILFSVTTALFVAVLHPTYQLSTARIVSKQIRDIDGIVLIHGSYGHQWQYELRQPVRAYREYLLEYAGAVVCLEECEGDEGFVEVMRDPVQVWIQKK